MSLDPAQAPEREQLLDEVLTAYLQAIDAGQSPDRQEWLNRHPHLAAELTEFFANQDKINRWTEPIRAAAEAPTWEGEAPAEPLFASGSAGYAQGTASPSRSQQESPEPCLGSFGDYELLEVIARGGMGVVYKARQKSLNRLVALKMIRAGRLADDADIQRFRREAETIALLDHPNIVPIYDIAEWRADDGSPPLVYFTMKLIEGGSLGQAVASGQLSVASKEEQRRAAQLVATVARAVHHAHQRGILHRDLKPSNILLAVSSDRIHAVDPKSADESAHYQPLVTDFGLAKRLEDDRSITELGAVVGTPNYLAPEQAWGKKGSTTTATDVYGLGTILYALLTGKPVFQGDSPLDVLEQVRNREPERPSKIHPAMDRDLETICLKCLEKEPARRYSSANALAEDLDRWLNGEPVQACPPSAWYRFRKFAQRNRVAVLSAGLVTAALVGATALSWWQAVVATQAKQDALEAAAAEKEAKETAEAKQAETQAILEFVESKVFAAARPEGKEGGLGREVTLRKAVETALPFVEKSFAERPLIEARLRMTVGKSLLYLGEADKAAEQFQKARILCTQHLGPEDPSTLGSMLNLANSYFESGRRADALSLREQTLALMKEKLGPNDPNTLVSMNNLAESYHALRRHAEALKLIEEALTRTKENLGHDHPFTFATMNTLGMTYAELGRHTEALKLLEETLALRKANLGLDHPDTLSSINNLGAIYEAVGRHADAISLLQNTLPVMKSKFGPAHTTTLKCMYNLAISYEALDRDADALRLRQETLELQKAKLGPDHPDTLMTMGGVASSLYNLDRGREAVPIIDECVERAAGKMVDPRMVPAIMVLRFGHFAKTKDAAGCRSTAEKWEGLKRTDAGSLYNAACMRAITAALIRASDKPEEAAAEADRAMAWLKQAVVKGYKDVEHMKKDSDLDPLRSREDFRKLISELEANAKGK